MAELEETVTNEGTSDDSETELQIEETTNKKRKTLRLEEGEVKYNVKFEKPIRKKRRNDYDPEEEARLERLVFGDHTDVINNLTKGNDGDTNSQSKSSDEDQAEGDETDGSDNDVSAASESGDDDEDDEDSSDDSGVEAADAEQGKKPAWVDDDEEENSSVKEVLRLQGRRLPFEQREKTYKEFLVKKYNQIVGTPKWAELDRKEEEGSEEDSDNEIFRSSKHLAKPKSNKLRPGEIQLKPLRNINHQTRNEGPVITSLQFHPTSMVALVAGLSGVLSIFHIDGKANSKLHSMQYKRFPINTAKFLKGGSEIVVGSQRHAHCHAYDLLAGKTYRIPLPHEMTNMKKFKVSPDEKLIAVCGRMGNVHLLNSKTKELVCNLKVNEQCTSVAFSPDSRKLFTHGVGGEMYVWDINERACIHRAMDDGCLSGTQITVSPSGQYLATGSQQGVVNVYDMDTVLKTRNPTPRKIILNLVTSITSLKFNPTSEILAMGSDEKDNAFKIMHLPSATIFHNFPTSTTGLGKPIAIDFSPGSAYLGITDALQTAYLYRLRHYKNY